MAARRPPDQAARDAAIAERARNVLIDAGAGTGKTTILVDRLAAMVAPADGTRPLAIGRLAAITFTRKAAGELRLRIRERLLRELALPGLAPARAAHLHEALGALDTAYVGTIHSFADRLLRLWPMEAELSPGYEIVEDETELLRETFDTLLHAAQSRTLAAELAAFPAAAARAEEAAVLLPLLIQAGLRTQSLEREWNTLHGLDALVAGFIAQRDVPPADPPADLPFDASAFQAAAREIVQAAGALRGSSEGARWLRDLAGDLHAHASAREPLTLYRVVRGGLASQPRGVTRRHTFEEDGTAWTVWKRWSEGGDGRGALREALLAPLHAWLARRLVRLVPVVVALYERVKARRQALDQLDLLVKLRDLLARDRSVRRDLQGRFDHIFVDEFQDTDPLQAEIVLFLAEAAPRADRWQDVELRPGVLTLVGDPKQSIYRFRRADVKMYDQVRALVARSAPLEVRLSANFRSAPPLIDWLNDRFARVLGTDPAGRPFDPATGRVFQQPLAAGRDGAPAPAVHVLPFDVPGGKATADEYRAVEGSALARYLRWLVEAGAIEVEDPLDRGRRRVRYGDIAVLAVSTWPLGSLFPALDREGVPYSSRGGTLFLADPLHRQFLLGLRALADAGDGVAEAALLRPPFFALDLADLARRPADDDGDGAAGARRLAEARDLVRELRRRRFDQSPGATARDLLERTAFGRAVAGGPNGAQRLARLRELCLVLEQRAARDGLDFDGVTAAMREWVTDPVQLDPPHPVGAEAVQVLTVHQAKGLEFPVVVLWDGMGLWRAQVQPSAWRPDRDGRGWSVSLDGLAWEEPAGLGLVQTEGEYLAAERRRVVYVAATRARDLLVVPAASGSRPGQHVCADLLAGADPATMRVLEAYDPGALPAWASARGPGRRPAPLPDDGREAEIARHWTAAAGAAGRARFRPVAVAEAAPALAAPAEDADEAPAKARPGRFGSAFGATVHRAIGLALSRPGLRAADAAREAAAVTSLAERLEETAADVERAVAALRAARLLELEFRLEYPLAGVLAEGELAAGYADFVAAGTADLVVLDFKSDAPPGPGAPPDARYVAQVRAYGQLLAENGLVGGRRLRCGLLYTADGEIRWVQ